MFLIRMKDGSHAKMRDGHTRADPVKLVEGHKFTLFDHLPGGVPPEGNTKIEVHAAADEAEAATIASARDATLRAAFGAQSDKKAAARAKIAKTHEANRAAERIRKGIDQPPAPPPSARAGRLSLAQVEGIKPIPAQPETESQGPESQGPEPPPAQPEPEPSADTRKGRRR